MVCWIFVEVVYELKMDIAHGVKVALKRLCAALFVRVERPSCDAIMGRLIYSGDNSPECM